MKVDEILGREKAEEAIKDAMVRYCHLVEGRFGRAIQDSYMGSAILLIVV